MTYEQKAAHALFHAGLLNTHADAYYNLYFREARKGLGIDGAVTIANEAIGLAEDAGRHDVVKAVRGAIEQMTAHRQNQVSALAA